MKNQNDMIKEVQALLEKGQIEEAIRLMESVPEAERGYELTGLLAREYANYGHSINHGESYLLKSLDLLESTREEGRNDPNWHCRMGYALMHLEREKEAIPYFDAVMQMIDDDPETQEFWSDVKEALEECRRVTDFLTSPSEQPLSYYEEKSYMLAIPWSDQEDTLFDREEKIRRISRMEGVEVLSVASENDGEQPFITISYHGETYAVDLSPYPAYDSYKSIQRRHIFSDEENEELAKAEFGLMVIMPFGKDHKSSFHFQLKLIDALMPEPVAIIDESAEQIFSGQWAHLAAASNTPPSPQYIYQIHAVTDEKDEVWLHTHGLARCGLPEIEILDAGKKNLNEIGEVMNAMACSLLDNEEIPETGEPVLLARFADNSPLVGTLIPWPEALHRYPQEVNGPRDDSSLHREELQRVRSQGCAEALALRVDDRVRRDVQERRGGLPQDLPRERACRCYRAERFEAAAYGGDREVCACDVLPERRRRGTQGRGGARARSLAQGRYLRPAARDV